MSWALLAGQVPVSDTCVLAHAYLRCKTALGHGWRVCWQSIALDLHPQQEHVPLGILTYSLARRN